MAVSDGKFLRGKVAHFTYRVVNGQQVVSGRSPKKKFAKTVPSKKSSTVFGQASGLASYFRHGTIWLYEKSNDGGMVNRMTRKTVYAIRSALDSDKKSFSFKQNSFKRLEGLNFNIKSPFENYLLTQPLVDYTMDNKVHICLPAMNIGEEMIFPLDSKKCKVFITVAQFDLEYGHYNHTEFTDFVIENNSSSRVSEAKFATFTTEPGCLCIIGMSLQYHRKVYMLETIMNNKQFNPAAIISAHITSGIVNKFAMKKWTKMPFKTGRQLLLPPPAPTQLLLGSANNTAA